MNKFKFPKVFVTIIVLFFVITAVLWIKVIQSWTVGLVYKLWKVQEQVLPDWLHFYNKLFTKINIVDTRDRLIKLETTTTSKEWLKFKIDLSIKYKVKWENIVNMARWLSTDLSDLILAYTNSTIDDVVTGKDKSSVYSDTWRVEITKAVKEKLTIEVWEYTVIKSVIIENIGLPNSIVSAIESQESAKAEAEKEKNLIEAERAKAERRKIEAEGISQANKIIQESLSDAYIKYESIQKINPNADVIYLDTDGLVPTLWLNK